MTIRLVLAEDSYLMREGLTSLLELADEIELVATCEDYDELMQQRLRILAEHRLGIADIQDVIDGMEPLEGAAELRPVVTGEAVGSRLEVLQGLSEGEPVVVRGNERLQPGAKVRISGDSS